MGSGNIGATNVLRSVGRKTGIVVLLLDIAKGFVAVWLAAMLTQARPLALGLATLAVMLGHCYPLFLRFKGGKAVACFIGAFLYLQPLALAVTALIFVAVVALKKYISLGSILGATAFPIIVWLTSRPPRAILIASILGALLIVYRHKANIYRIRSGSEHVFTFRSRAA